ncbi:MAG: hypothetical protein RLW61_17940 [Gammaproteobacteria bacterium]
MRRVWRSGAVIAGALFVLASHANEAPFNFVPPPPLAAAGVQRALLGNTHTYRAAGVLPRLTITTMPVREIDGRFGALSGRSCIEPFLAELAQAHGRFFVAGQARPLAVGGHQLRQFRWSGEKDGRVLTGVLSCGRLGRYYYVFDFVDELIAATTSFPRIRASLRALAPDTEADRKP